MSDDTLLIILGNQLFDKRYLSEAETKNIFMAEDFGLCTEEKYHKQKRDFSHPGSKLLSCDQTVWDEKCSNKFPQRLNAGLCISQTLKIRIVLPPLLFFLKFFRP